MTHHDRKLEAMAIFWALVIVLAWLVSHIPLWLKPGD